MVLVQHIEQDIENVSCPYMQGKSFRLRKHSITCFIPISVDVVICFFKQTHINISIMSPFLNMNFGCFIHNIKKGLVVF